MRILVASDTHGMRDYLRRAILSQPHADVVVFLGDGEQEALSMKQSFPEKMFLLARGNGDWSSSQPMEGVFSVFDEVLGEIKIFYTHGHLYGVKSGDYQLRSAARDKGAKIVLYGHTHESRTDYEDGVYVMNPGALSGWKPSFGIIDITPQGIVTNVVPLV